MNVTRLFDLLDNYIENYPDQDAALVCKREGAWKKFSICEYVELTNDLSYGMLALGIQPGDKIGIVSSNRPEWNMLDFAAMQIGAVSIPIYPTISQNDYSHILNHAEMKMIFIEGKELRTKLKPILPEIKTLKEIFTFSDENSEYKYLDQLITLGKENRQPDKLIQLKASIKPDDLATIIYTSGTTGSQKGVMLSHQNIVSQLKSLESIPAKWSNKALSFLPLCHAYERMLVYLYQYLGMSVYYAESLGTIAENIKEINPTMMSCVPRLLEKIYDKLYLSGKKLPFFSKIIYYWAFNLATKFQLEEMGWYYNIKYKLAEKLIYSKWRAAIGGNFDIVVSGGSAIQPHIASFFSAIGMPVFEGYGLSETSPVIAVSQRGENGRKFGTVGLPLQGVEVKLAERDEIICRGHNVMLGYYKDPALTAQAIDNDGWFHTGDTGKFTPEGQLIITGRLKSIFKTSFGKYVNPQAIESRFTESAFIENMIVLGENKKFAAALLSPDFIYLKSWCNKHKIKYSTNAEMIEHPAIVKRYQEEIKHYNQFFGDFEQIKRYKLVPDEWTTADGFLSPTLKIKRNVIESHYADAIEKLFS
ncbi:AMP-dependent synthetase and ligase [Paludibacter propionicigenes WB4]|uniref:AMP-dependent synthetase and ligase n=1 Tax=Paludibacter propionicigenes (strain DSM 17365 / JCM 13257 / WB4) TaxID=694427 RepID=E4T8J3_PALPW|nr:long-chain fatty acid--CoA ligase [Paludibacter propionicigenes]ADQ81037.1 AMP-dependent synthetase and ligase [Paludibacter propionicigenes WB4]